MAISRSTPPAIFSIPAGVPFLDALTAGLLPQFPAAADLLDAQIYLPTRRAVRALSLSLAHASTSGVSLLPRIGAIGDVDPEDLMDEESFPGLELIADIPPAIPPLKREALLARMVHRWSAKSEQRGVRWNEAFALARELAQLIDAVHTEELDFRALRDAAPAEFAAHWGETLSFLEIITRRWPEILAERGEIDPADRRSRVLRAISDAWRQTPPQRRILVAGSTGSIPATADFLDTVARLPHGSIVLPGLDREMDDDSWAALEPSHPQFQMRQLLRHMGVDRSGVKDWPLPQEWRSRARLQAERHRLAAEALRPARTISAWPELTFKAKAALRGLSKVECPTPREEAVVIAMAMRQTLETPGKTAALITRDRRLARRVAGELSRWEVEVDDSAGVPLSITPPGVFLALMAKAAVDRFAPVSFLSLMKHPLAARGKGRGAFLSKVRRLEVAALRGPRPRPGIAGLAGAAQDVDDPELSRFMSALKPILAPLEKAAKRKRIAIADILERHVEAARKLNGYGRAGAESLFSGEAGETLAQLITAVTEATAALPPIAGRDFSALLDEWLGGQVVRAPYDTHPRLAIWGPLEARMMSADLVIAGGLNESSWPPAERDDPWLNRPIRQKFGLTGDERRIGQSAHDFVSALSGQDVMLTRSEKVDGTPTVRSRWLVRLEALASPLPGGDHPWLAWQRSLEEPSSVKSAAPPAPRPPMDARPRTYWVTDIQALMRDPYTVYAKRILGLRPLDPIDPDPGPAERGSVMHRILERFVVEYPGEPPDHALDDLLYLAREELDRILPRPGLRAAWWPRFERAVRAFFIVHQQRMTESAVAGTEVSGEMVFSGSCGDWTLKAKADRVDRKAGGGLVVIDYKTGALPPVAQVESGLAPQLPLEGLIAESGGFEHISAEEVIAFEYWCITGGRNPLEIKPLKGGAQKLIAATRGGVENLVRAFLDPDTPYLSNPRPRTPGYGEYDHLARRAEWFRLDLATREKP